jgi:hypothetical protein
MRPAPIGTAAARANLLLARDLLSPSSPYSPITPSSTVAFGFNTFKRTTSETKEARAGDNSDDGFVLSAPPTPTSTSAGVGVIVKMSGGQLAVKTFRKTLRIVEDEQTVKDTKEKGKADVELAEGDSVEYKTDGQKAFSVKRKEV